MDKKFDVVIIGGGISGLTLGAILGKVGINCCIVEKEHQAGGYIAGYVRKNFHFDTAIHWLNQFGKTGISHRVFSFIDKDYPKPLVLNNIQRYKTDNYDILLQTNIKEVEESFISNFPNEKAGIIKFFKDAEQLANFSNNISNFARSHEAMNMAEKAIYYTKMLPYVFPLFKHLKYTGETGINKGLSKYFKGDEIKSIFNSEIDLLSCLFPIAWAKNKDYFTTPDGGSVKYVNWLLQKNKTYGNAIMLNTQATSVLLKNKKAIGITAVNNKISVNILSDYVVSASSLPALYNKLLPRDAITQNTKQKLETSLLYKSGFTVSVALNCTAEELVLSEELVLLSKNNTSRNEHENSDPLTSKLSIIAPSVRDKTICPKGKGIVTIYMSAEIEKYNYWNTKKDTEGQIIRTKAYYKLKKDIAETIIDRVENELIPNFKKNILFFDTASPITYQRYTDNYKGTIMGQRPGKVNMQNKVASHFTEIDNLLVGGQWAELGGGIPISAQSAMNTALIILRKTNKKAFRLLAKYFDGKLSLEKINIGD